MTVYELIEKHERTHPESHFFDRDTLKFFGERISDMTVFKNTQVISKNGEDHECYVLSSLQRNNPLGPKRTYHFFDAKTFDFIYL